MTSGDSTFGKGARLAVALAVVVVLATGMGLHATGVESAFASGTSLTTASVTKTPVTKKTMKMTMAGGDVANLKTSAVGTKVKWSSSNKKIATVKPTGNYTAKVTAIKPGTTTITAKSKTQTITCTVTVTGKISKRTLALTPFQTSTLSLSTYKNVGVKSWASSNKSCVKVSSGGKVTPIATGSAVITCTDKKGYKYRCAVSVNCPAITCKISDGGSRRFDGEEGDRFLKNFELTNGSAKDIVLDTDPIRYYPSNTFGSLVYYNLSGYDRDTTSSSFSERPVTVKKKDSANPGTYSFAGKLDLGAENFQLLDTGRFSLTLKVGGNHYEASFASKTGKPLSLTRV